MSESKIDPRVRVSRGGCWYGFEPSWVLAASRDADVPAYRSYTIGFRCALRGREPRV